MRGAAALPHGGLLAREDLRNALVQPHLGVVWHVARPSWRARRVLAQGPLLAPCPASSVHQVAERRKQQFPATSPSLLSQAGPPTKARAALPTPAGVRRAKMSNTSGGPSVANRRSMRVSPSPRRSPSAGAGRALGGLAGRRGKPPAHWRRHGMPGIARRVCVAGWRSRRVTQRAGRVLRTPHALPAFCHLFGPEHLGEFLGYFMVRKMIVGQELLRASGTVTGKFVTWLAARGYIDRDSAEMGGPGAARGSWPSSSCMTTPRTDAPPCGSRRRR